jgi:hypothetical protein
LSNLCQKSAEYEDFALLLYELFDSHGKANDLMYWAVNTELSAMPDSYAFFRSDTITTKLFVALLFGDLGRMYLTTTIAETVTTILSLKESLEVRREMCYWLLIPFLAV